MSLQTTNLVQVYNNFTMVSAAQHLLSCLSLSDLFSLLQAIEPCTKHQQLSQLVRSRIVVCLAEQVDRSYYFTHYDDLAMDSFKQERACGIAGKCEENMLKNLLKSFQQIEVQGKLIFKEEF